MRLNPSAMSLILKCLPLFLILVHGVRADFVYHDNATTGGGEFSTVFSIGNLKNAGHGSPADLDDAADGNASYATTNPPAGGYPVTLTLDFNTPVDLTQFHLWNHSNKNGAAATNAGVKNFTLTFHSDSGGGGSQIGAGFSGTAKAAPATGTYAAQTFDFGTTYPKVRSVKLVILNRILGNGFVAMREIGFERTAAPSQSPAPTPDKILVYLVGGQSNADGYGISSQLPAALRAPQPDIDFYHGNGGGFSTLPANQWLRLQSGSGSMKGNVGGFGPELNFGIGMHQALDAPTARIALVKHTRGGSSLHTDWLASGNATTTRDGPDYQAFQNTVNSALASLAALYPGATVQLEGMVWHQGEADAGSPTTANAYKTHLTRFITDIRATYGKDLKFGIVQLSNKQTLLNPDRLATVKAAQAAVATAHPRNYLVTTDDLPMGGASTIHLGTPGNLTIGSRLAAGMQQVPSPGNNR
ncbi:MAG: hypothetical protein RLZZ245_2245 [Verrucomicrobiota bacterium]